MKNTLRIGQIFMLIALVFVVGCSDDSVTEPPPPPPATPDPAGSIGVFMDQGGSNNNITDTGSIITLYVVHDAPEVTASMFRVQAPTGWTLLGSLPQFPVAVGNVETGISLGYGTCMNNSILVMTVTYMCPGNTPVGEGFTVLPHGPPNAWEPAYSEIRVVDCSSNLLLTATGVQSPVTIVP